jgi:putative ABC transport system permease protein
MLQLSHIKKDYYIDKQPFTALKDISLTFPDKGFVSVLGPSGCGKTTLLNIIGGLDHYTEGDLVIDGKSTKDFKDPDWDAYRNERVGFVFQTYNLIPHMNVIANVEVSLMLNGVSASERKVRSLKALKAVGLEEEARKKPNQLSGGQMQRVALARALVNNPKIVLADEPTGALDSVTSVQVMDLLKAVASDRLVIMVTHNEDLANKYSDRIITMKDGTITSDSAPINDVPLKVVGKETNKRTAMTFRTAIRSAISNIKTKMGRTALTAVASSFGIIGVAMVLAVNYGFTNYVDGVETSVATSVPITIEPVSAKYTNSDKKYTAYPSDHDVQVYDSNSSYATIHYNNITTDYVDKVLTPLEKDGLASITYNYNNFYFNVVTEDGNTGGYTYVKQFKDAGLSGSLLSYISVPSSIFHEIPGSKESILKNYDVIDGRYPDQSDELLLIVDKYNRIDYATLKYLGILNSDNSPNTDLGQVKSGTDSFSYDKIVYSGETDDQYKIFKAYQNTTFYRMNESMNSDNIEPAYKVTGISYDSTNKKLVLNKTGVDDKGNPLTKTLPGYRRVSNNSTGYGKVYNNQDGKYPAKELKVVGVLRQKTDSYVDMMPPSIGYLTSLKDEMLADRTTDNGKLLGQNATNNWYLHRPNSDDSTDSVAKLEEALNSALTSMSTVSTDATAGMTTNDIYAISQAVYYENGYAYDNAKYGTNGVGYSGFLANCQSLGASFNQAGVQPFFDDVFAISTDKTMSDSDKASKLANIVLDVFDDPGFYSSDVKIQNSYGIRLIDLIAYSNRYSLISSINITPSNLAAKNTIRARLDEYNNSNPNTEVIYSDYMSMFTSTLATFIRIISIVLIVFASISLVVSSVMTGIITYTSVVERIKEIGILRACGARKKDVGRLFEAECFVIGFIAGLIGIAFTYLACIPIDQVIYAKYKITNIALLNPWHGAVLLALSVLLAFLSGLIPARLAAKKDPVTALRTE